MRYQYMLPPNWPPDRPGQIPAPSWPPLPLGWQLWLAPATAHPGYGSAPLYSPPPTAITRV